MSATASNIFEVVRAAMSQVGCRLAVASSAKIKRPRGGSTFAKKASMCLRVGMVGVVVMNPPMMAIKMPPVELAHRRHWAGGLLSGFGGHCSGKHALAADDAGDVDEIDVGDRRRRRH